MAVANREEKDITLYGSGEEKLTIKENQIPSFPLLVVKQNERLIVNNSNSAVATQMISAKGGSSNIAYQGGGLSLSFADESCNGTKTNSVIKKANHND